MSPTIRERVSDTLIRTGTELAFDQRDLERGIDAVPSDTPGYTSARQAVWLARGVETAMLWLGWRLARRPAAPTRPR
jgi:hypothetical protein